MSLRAQARHAVFVPEKGAAIRRAHALQFPRGETVKRLAIAAARVLGAFALSALLGLAAVQAYQWSTRSALLAVRKVEVRGNVHAASSDLAAAARGVESSPWIVSASVSRHFPSGIEIEVREHIAAARVRLGADYFSDYDGKLFKRVDDADDAQVRALPILTGLARDSWDTRRDETQLALRTGLQLVADWAAAGLAPAELSEVRAESDGAFTAVAKNSQVGSALPQEIRVGKGPFAANLHRLTRIRAELQRRGQEASRIDLDNPARPDEAAAQIVRNDEPTSHPRAKALARGE